MGSATPGGTDPLPGESEEEYVARQKKLQAEVDVTMSIRKTIHSRNNIFHVYSTFQG